MVEYTTILALVAAGIMLGGPFVIRSWNANLKSIEDSVTDSFNDPLLEDLDPNIPLPGCTCGLPEVEIGCGVVPCAITQMAKQQTCTGGRPECGLFNPIVCAFDSRCCTHPVFHNRSPDYCGVNACTNITGKFSSLAPDEKAIFIAALTDACDLAPPPLAPLIRPADNIAGCPDGELLYYPFCGDDTAPVFSCERDAVTCDFNCDPEEPPGTDYTWTKCEDDAGDPDDETGLTGDTPRTYVYTCTADAAHKCEAMCCPNFCVEN